MTRANAKLLVGRRIVGYDPRPFSDGRGGTAYDPLITLDNGATLSFSTLETETGEYGTDINYHPKSKK